MYQTNTLNGLSARQKNNKSAQNPFTIPNRFVLLVLEALM